MILESIIFYLRKEEVSNTKIRKETKHGRQSNWCGLELGTQHWFGIVNHDDGFKLGFHAQNHIYKS